MAIAAASLHADHHLVGVGLKGGDQWRNASIPALVFSNRSTPFSSSNRLMASAVCSEGCASIPINVAVFKFRVLSVLWFSPPLLPGSGTLLY